MGPGGRGRVSGHGGEENRGGAGVGGEPRGGELAVEVEGFGELQSEKNEVR